MPEITLEPGSPSERVAQHLKANPHLMMPRADVARLLGITPALVDNALQAGIGMALITAFNDSDLGRCYKAGPRLAYWEAPKPKGHVPPRPLPPPAAPAPAAAAPAAAAPAAVRSAPAKKTGGNRGPKKYLPELQLSLLTVQKGLPLPVGRGVLNKGQTKYDGLLDMLKADGDVVTGISKEYDGAIRKAITAYLKHRPQLNCQLVVRNTDAEHIGVWRLAAGTVKDTGRTGLKAA